MKEEIVTSGIGELGCTAEAFLEACEASLKGSNRTRSQQTRSMLDLLLYLDDFEVCLSYSMDGAQALAEAGWQRQCQCQ